MKRISVSNIHLSSTEEDLERLFEEFGTVLSVELFLPEDQEIMTKLAWVEMEDETEAEEAVAELNGEWFDGESIRVRFETEVTSNGSTSKATDLDIPPDWEEPGFEKFTKGRRRM